MADDYKKLIPVIRKLMPEIIAHDLVNVQPMTGSTGEIFNLKNHNRWTGWERKFTIWPKRSVYGKLRWGRLYRRATLNGYGKVELYNHHPDWKEQWATKKELFKWKLAGNR